MPDLTVELSDEFIASMCRINDDFEKHLEEAAVKKSPYIAEKLLKKRFHRFQTFSFDIDRVKNAPNPLGFLTFGKKTSDGFDAYVRKLPGWEAWFKVSASQCIAVEVYEVTTILKIRKKR